MKYIHLQNQKSKRNKTTYLYIFSQNPHILANITCDFAFFIQIYVKSYFLVLFFSLNLLLFFIKH